MVTAAGVAHSNRLPVLILSGDVFANRRPDPVLQQVEHFGNPTISVNDAFKPVTRYWDRITHPEQIISSLPQAVAAMLDPADCGPAFIGLCQDTQEIAFDYPARSSSRGSTACRGRGRTGTAGGGGRDAERRSEPLIIAGGGVRYSAAPRTVAASPQRGIPVAETIAGKGACPTTTRPMSARSGVIGSRSANALAGEADVVLAIGTRLQDFTTGSWTAVRPDAAFVSINAARFDAAKHRALPVVGDALEPDELDAGAGRLDADAGWMQKGREEFAAWNALLDDRQTPTNAPSPTYAQVVGAVNRKAGERDLMVTAAGGLPGEVTKGWKVKAPGTFDCEFGFSCMGYEIAGGWGAAMADPSRDADRHGRRRLLPDDEFATSIPRS